MKCYIQMLMQVLFCSSALMTNFFVIHKSQVDIVRVYTLCMT